MPRSSTLDAVLREAISSVVARIVPSIARDVSALVKREVSAAVKARAASSRARAPARPLRGVNLTHWVADRRARRVPKFVIEMTGLDTKKKIVARFGQDAAFTKRKPLPRAVHRGERKPAVRAKPPIVRRKAKAAA